MIGLRRVSHHFHVANRRVLALEEVSLTIPRGAFFAISGPSGSGKSTLLGILGLLATPTKGRYFIGAQDICTLGDARKSALRAKMFGFLFQSFRLIPTKTVLQNVLLPMEIAQLPGDRAEWHKRATRLLEEVGLAERAQHVPAELSGGEAQRVAFARALAANPGVLLADEPTGNLDPANRDAILEHIAAFHARGGTVVMVTHSSTAARAAERTFEVSRGRLRANAL